MRYSGGERGGGVSHNPWLAVLQVGPEDSFSMLLTEVVPVFWEKLKLKVGWGTILEAWLPPRFEPSCQDATTPLSYVDMPTVVTYIGCHWI